MNDRHSTPWLRLAAACRRASRPACEIATVDDFAPAGFATRVVARAGLGVSPGLFGGFAFEHLAARALGFACAGALAVTIWASVPATAEARSTDAASSTDVYLDPVGAIIDAVQS